MILEKLRAENFRLLEDFTIEFDGNVTVLVGPNNSGKSNIVDALLLVSDAIRLGSLGSALDGRQGVSRVVSRHDIGREILIEVTLQQGQ